jgi:hypothetical protein
VAKAESKASTHILLKDALARVIAEVHAPPYAQQLIVRWITKEQLPWGYKTREGFCGRGMSPDDMIQVLWKRNPRINWEESSVAVLVALGGGLFVVYGVWVAAEVLDARLASLGSGILDSLLKPKPWLLPPLAGPVTAAPATPKPVTPVPAKTQSGASTAAPRVTLKSWLPKAVDDHPKGPTQLNAVYARHLKTLEGCVWDVRSIENELSLLTKVSQKSLVRQSRKRSRKNEKQR